MRGSASRATIGCTRKSRNEPVRIVRTKSGRACRDGAGGAGSGIGGEPSRGRERERYETVIPANAGISGDVDTSREEVLAG